LKNQVPVAACGAVSRPSKVTGAAPLTYDGREKAPHAANGTWFFRDGQPMEFSDAQPGGKSVGVPGNVRMMALAHHDHGKLAWAALFQPAIKLARDGFKITPRLHNSLLKYPATGALSAEAAREAGLNF
jgi:gamma-glutamyltranspeptidase/glutathione hydrolase